MKKTVFFSALLLSFLVITFSSADKARFLHVDNNQAYHSNHLIQHLGSRNCKVSGNYIKIRTKPGGNKVSGHLEQSDVFIFEELHDHWAKITVTCSSRTSPDSRPGLTGWIDADYLECPCSEYEYYNGPAHTSYSIGTISAQETRLRDEASKNGTILAILHEGEQVEVISEYMGKANWIWYRVRYPADQQVGYIRSDQLQVSDEIYSEDLPIHVPQAGKEAP